MAKLGISVSQRKLHQAIHLKLSLMDNAYNFLNQSLRHYRKASRSMNEWPFALLHLTQTVELMLKYRLCMVSRILIYEDIDHPRNTVSLEKALGRLEGAGIRISNKEKTNIRKAASFRHQVVHYEVELNKFQWKRVYAQLFEFVHFFHHLHFSKELHTRIDKDNWAVEGRLMTYFRKNFVIYSGVEMPRDYPREITAGQRITHFVDSGRKFPRIRYGDEPGILELYPNFADLPCHDCFVVKGQYHLDGCDVDVCPRCRRQLFGCGCF